MVASYRLKFSRAIEHGRVLQSTVERWAQDDPCAVVTHADVKTRQHFIHVRTEKQPNDPAIQLLIGDCAHNARQCLDHLAYRLAVHVAGVDPPPNEETAQFAIMTLDRHQFDSALSQKIGPKKALSPDLYALLERLQPYNGGETEWLAVLHLLDNTDKHRFPPVVAGIAQVDEFVIGHVSVSQLAGPRLGAIDDETPVMDYTPTPGTAVDMDFQFTPSIAFDKASPVAPGQPVLVVLDRILNLIGSVLPEFEANL